MPTRHPVSWVTLIINNNSISPPYGVFYTEYDYVLTIQTASDQNPNQIIGTDKSHHPWRWPKPIPRWQRKIKQGEWFEWMEGMSRNRSGLLHRGSRKMGTSGGTEGPGPAHRLVDLSRTVELVLDGWLSGIQTDGWMGVRWLVRNISQTAYSTPYGVFTPSVCTARPGEFGRCIPSR